MANTDINGFQRVLIVLMTVIFPPLPIIILKNYSVFNKEFLISLILTALGHIPGIIFTLWYCFIEYPSAAKREGYENIDDESNVGINPRPQSSVVRAPYSDADPQEDAKKDVPVPAVPTETSSSNHDEPIPEYAPPDYEAVAGSGSSRALEDSKSSDNKVQH